MVYSVWLPKSDFFQRFLTTVVAVPAVVYIVLQKPIYIQMLMLCIAFGVFREWSRLALAKSNYAMNYLCLGLLALMFVPNFFTPALICVTLSCVCFYLLQRTQINNALIVMAGYLYLTLSLAILIHIFPFIHGSYFVLLILVMIWLVDIGAFLVGKTLGGPKLAPSISPNKTWSGFFGGIIISSIGTWILYNALNLEGLPYFWAFVAIALPLAQAGDLIESWCKRYFNVKDSGSFLPGHGGLLDRLDSIFAVSFAIVLWWYLCK